MKTPAGWFSVLCALGISCSVSLAADAPGFDIQLDTICSGFDKKTCWVHPRAGAIPGNPPGVVLTMQKLLLTGSDVFFPLNEMRTDDLGKTWSGPLEHAATLGRREEPDGIIVGACDFWPKWHAKSGKLLGIRYRSNTLIGSPKLPEQFVIRDDAFDCVTYCEAVLAAAVADAVLDAHGVLLGVFIGRVLVEDEPGRHEVVHDRAHVVVGAVADELR